MKVNNFSELDKVLKKSFIKIKDDVNKSKKELDLKLKEAEKKQKNSADLINTKIKFVSDEIKQFKNYKNELINEQKNALNGLKEEQKSYKEQLKADYDKELGNLVKDTDRLKENFLKVMDILKDKLVTKKSFEDNNLIVEKAINDLIEKTKDIEQIKFNYFSKLNVNRQLNNVQSDFKEFKEDFYKVKETLESLDGLKQQFTEFKDSSNTKFVLEEAFLNKNKELNELKENYEDLQLKFSRLGDQNSSSVDIQLFNNEIEDIRKRLSMISDIKEQMDNLATKQLVEDKISHIEDIQGKQDLLIDELKVLKEEINANKELKKEIEELKEQLEKSEHKIEKNSVMIEMIRDTKSTIKIKEPEIEEKKEELISSDDKFELKDPFSEEESHESGLFKRTLKGITGFFLEDDEDETFNLEESSKVDQIYSESLSGSQVSYKPQNSDNSQIGDTKFVAEIEKMFDEKPETPEINIKLDTENKENSFLNKIKTGVVNFFFEEVEDDEFVFQSEEIEKEDEAKLDEPEKMPKVEIVETHESALKNETSNETKTEEVNEVPKKRGRKSKTETSEINEEFQEDKKVHYMRTKKPRIFQDLEEENESSADSEVEDLTKTKKKGKKASASNLAEEDYVYYPEDYFY